MKISLDWLSDYIETGLGADRIAETLSDLGFPCEGIEHLDNDDVIDVEITSNRGDCLGYIGIARELAVATGRKLKISDIELDELDRNVTQYAGVEIIEPDLCGRYTARIIDGVKVAPSPDWLKERLQAVGMRSVNNVVDATNYAMMETGQPPHAFDYNKITDGRIIVRRANAGERLTSIDGSQCVLNTDMLVIADTKVPVAVAGVMGGLDTEVSDTTTTILLEDAHFNPVSVRTTSRKLALPSEAAFRFERIVDIEMVDWASKRTAQLITRFAGGKVAKGVVDIYPKKPQKKEVTLRLSRLKWLLGIEVPREEAMKILSALCFTPEINNDLIRYSVPSWRSDVYREVDLIEEVARVYGYSKVPTERKIKIEVVPVDARQKLNESIGTYLNGCGFYETVNVDFVDDSTAELFSKTDAGKHLAVNDASGKSVNLLRQTLIGSLLGVLKTNLNAGNSPCKIFEIADTFVPNREQSDVLPIQKAKLALVCDSDFRDMRGVIEGLVRNIDRQAQVDFEPAELLWAKTGAEIIVNSKKAGTAGIISKAVNEKYDFKEISPCAAELEYEQLSILQSDARQIKPLPRFPAIQRDLSIIVDDNVSWADIIAAVNAKAPDELEDVRFIGIYKGKGIPSDQKSVTFSLRYRDEDGTLTHQTVDGFEADIVKSLTESVKAVLRTL
ncbi:MAG: phenylalanine--tRNA ligase subunit beta [Sedimentisphaerales bacterium]|nr:phenylalanine--tRNA ligase subunit beta [Sedimentisphaerales bacterium]